ncbi:MAG: DNA mismatch repair protein MutS, partial [Planctomycetota bacterium]|nr:DNA mismatch repair protein MutS [Planctomycetota bacterium]
MSQTSHVNQALTPAMEQWRQIKSQHPDKLVFFRMGDFYELFFDDALAASRLLNLTLTSRTKGENPIPMAGVPYHACSRYLRDLLAKGQKVVLVDQLEDPKQAKGVVKRGVTRVITPGTVLEDDCLTGRENNFLAACATADAAGAAACLDLSTGEFLVFTAPAAQLAEEIAKYTPAEIILPQGAELEAAKSSGGEAVITARPMHFFDPVLAADLLKRHFQVA